MDRLLPIEPGCLCLFTGDAPTEVRAVRFIGNPSPQIIERRGGKEIWTAFNGDTWWELDRLIEKKTDEGTRYLDNKASERYLLRIDGNDFSHETEQEKERVEG